MKEENEPKPGYLGQNLDGHKEPVPEMAWADIEDRLNGKKRRGLFFWIFGVLGIILTGWGWWEFNPNQPEMAVQPKQNVHEKHQEVISPENSRPEKPVSDTRLSGQIPGSDSGSRKDMATSSSANGQTKKEEVLNESKNRSQSGSAQKESNDFVFSKPVQKGRQAVSVSKNRDALPGTFPLEGISSQAPGTKPEKKNGKRTSRQSISTSVLAFEPLKPNPVTDPKKEIQTKLSTGNSESNSSEPDLTTDPVSSRISSTESKTGISPKTGSVLEKPNLESNGNQEDQNKSQSTFFESQPGPSVVSATSDSIPKKSVETVANPDSQAVSQTDSTHPQNPKRNSRWMLSVHAGLMLQNSSLQQDYFSNGGLPMVSISPSDISKTPSFRLAISRLWQLSRSLWLGIEVSANGIFQKASAILNPSEETPIRYEYGADSLSVLAVTGYQNLHQNYNRNTLIAGVYPRIQWKPGRSPIGIQARFRVASFTHVLNGQKPTEAFEYMPQNWEIGLWAPISERHQISIDCSRMPWTQNSLPVPVKNPGKNWILSVGYGWKW